MKVLLFLLLALPAYGYAHDQGMGKDTFTFQFHKYYPGKEIKLEHGSAQSQDFAFIYWGYDEPANGIGAKWCNTIVKVEKIYTWNDRTYIQCKVDGLNNKFNIDVEHALEYGEIK